MREQYGLTGEASDPRITLSRYSDGLLIGRPAAQSWRRTFICNEILSAASYNMIENVASIHSAWSNLIQRLQSSCFLCLLNPSQHQALGGGDGALSLGRNASTVATLLQVLEIEDGTLDVKTGKLLIDHKQTRTYVSRDSVVPNDNSVGLPLDTGLVIAALVDVVVEEVQNSV